MRKVDDDGGGGWQVKTKLECK